MEKVNLSRWSYLISPVVKQTDTVCFPMWYPEKSMALFLPRKQSLSLAVKKHWMVPTEGCTEWKAFTDMRNREKTEEWILQWRRQTDMTTKFNHVFLYMILDQEGEKETLLGGFGETGVGCVDYMVVLCNVDFLMITIFHTFPSSLTVLSLVTIPTSLRGDGASCQKKDYID